jgi:hypothetical protein
VKVFSLFATLLLLPGTLPAAGLPPAAAAYAGKNPAADKDSYTPLPLDAGYGPLDTSPPPIPAEQIIARFAAKESLYRQALDNYAYRRSVRVQTVEDGKVDGEYQQVDEISFDQTGRRYERTVFAPANTLERITMSPADFDDIEHRLPFVLTSEDVAQYDIRYVGRQKVDELDCYVFDVGPRRIEKGRRYLQGRIWVEANDLQIVVTNGKNVPDDTRKGHEDLSPPFATYREQIDGKYWFPVYTKGEGILHFAGGSGTLAQDVHIREIVKYTDYKQFRSTARLIFEGQDVTGNGARPGTAPEGQTPPQGQGPAAGEGQPR